MRKRTMRIVAVAAVTAVPAFAFADDVGAPDRQAQQFGFNSFQQQQLFPAGVSLSGGKFTLNPQVQFNPGPDADVDGTWVGLGASNSWNEAANWSTNPLIPDGNAAIARFNNASGGPITTLGTSTVTVNQLNTTDQLGIGIIGGQFNLGGVNPTIHTNGVNFDLPSVVFTFGTGFNTIGGAGTLSTTIGGGGLNKTGDSHIQIDSPATYTGPVNISGGGKIVTTVGDAAFGNAGNAITLNNGSIQVSTVDWTSNRTINVGAGGGSVYVVGAGRTWTQTGNITGSSTLTVNGIFGGSVGGIINSNTSFTGTLNLAGPPGAGGGSFTINGSGQMANASFVRNNGTMVLGGGGVNRLGDSTPIHMNGVLRHDGGGTEDMGPLTLTSSTSWIMGISSGTTLSFDSITRSANRPSAAFRVNGLGSSSTVTFSNGTASLKGGIIPWAYVNAGDPISTNPESENNTLATYGANGVTPVTTLETNQANWNAGVNALISDAGATINNSVNVNALVLRVSDFYFNTPMTTSGTGTINLTTGVILSGNAGFDAGGLINSSPGNVVNVNINAGTNELIIHTPSAVTFNGVITGSGGLTKTGGRTAFFNGDNTYTGTTILSGFNRFNDDVIAGVPGPFGTDASAVILDGGVFAPTNPAGAANGTMVGILALENNSGAATFSRGLTVRGVGNILRNFSNDVLTMSGPIVLEDPNSDLLIQAFGVGGGGVDQFVVSGVISGPGHLSATNTASGGATPQFLRLTAANTFTGGFDAGGLIQVGNNNALGAGSVTMAEDTTFEAFGAPRTVPNAIVVYTGDLITTGSNTFTFGGVVDGRGGGYVFNTGAPTVVSGQLAGGSLFKEGAQTLTLSGSSPNFPGQINVGNGETPGNILVIANGGAVGNTALGTAANVGENTVLLAPGVNVTTDESFISRGEGVGQLGSLRLQSGVATWGGSFFVQEQTTEAGVPLTTKGSVGVDSGSLTIQGSVFTLGTNGAGQPAQPLGFRKVGAGVLNVGSAEFTSGTSTFQGSVVTTGSFEISGGTVRMLPNAGPPAAKSVADVASISIAGGPGAPTARLDLTNNAMVVDYASGGPSPLQDVRSYIIAGYAGGAWTGNGISTSNGNAQNFGLGYSENNGSASGTNFTVFLGDPVDNSAVLVRFTRYGDANIDGTVNLADFNRLAANFGLAAGAVWGQGDFTYDGIVNLSDFNRLAANFGLSAGPDGVVDPEDWAALAGAIPEPGTLSLLAVAGLGLLKRRRRNSR